jgi:hypothetical protein
MKTVSAVRWVVLLTVLLSSCEVAAVSVGGRPAEGGLTKCERCGQTGPTIPAAPVVFRGQIAVAFEVPPTVEKEDSIVAVFVRDEFGSGVSRPVVGAAVTR